MTTASESAGSRVAQGLRDRLRTGALAPGTVLSQAEIHPRVRLKTVGSI